jgi:hypothetical protein
LTEQTRQAVDDYVRAAAKKPGECMFTGRPGSEKSITTRQYARLRAELVCSSARHSVKTRHKETCAEICPQRPTA